MWERGFRPSIYSERTLVTKKGKDLVKDSSNLKGQRFKSIDRLLISWEALCRKKKVFFGQTLFRNAVYNIDLLEIHPVY